MSQAANTPLLGGNNVTSVKLFKNVITIAKENCYPLKDIKIIFYVSPSIVLQTSMAFCSSFNFFPKRTKHAWSPKIQSSFSKQWFPGLFLLLGDLLFLLTCKQNFKSRDKDFTENQRARTVNCSFCSRSVLQFVPKEQGFFPLILPMTILIGMTRRLMQPSPSTLQTGIPVCGEEEGEHQHTALQAGRTRQRWEDVADTNKNWIRQQAVRLGQALPSGLTHAGARTPLLQEPVGCFHAISVLVVQLEVQRE